MPTSLNGAVETIWKNDMEDVAGTGVRHDYSDPCHGTSLMLYVLLPLKVGHIPQGLAQILLVLELVTRGA